MSVSDLLDEPDRERFIDEFDPIEDAQLIRELVSVAHHEAGHGCVAMSFGVPVEMSIQHLTRRRRSDGQHIADIADGTCWYLWETPPPHKQLRLISLGGAVAQMRHLGEPLVMSNVLRWMSRSDMDGAGTNWTEGDIAWVVAILSWRQAWIDGAVESLLDAGEFADVPDLARGVPS